MTIKIYPTQLFLHDLPLHTGFVTMGHISSEGRFSMNTSIHGNIPMNYFMIRIIIVIFRAFSCFVSV